MWSQFISLAFNPASMEIFLSAVPELNVPLRFFPKLFQLSLKLPLLAAHLAL
jgi:hypothetical protein